VKKALVFKAVCLLTGPIDHRVVVAKAGNPQKAKWQTETLMKSLISIALGVCGQPSSGRPDVA
jgi:hypothetical protein